VTRKPPADDTSARERILTAAAELFAQSGFDATPTSKIAELAGVPKGLVHYYFRFKPDLLTALVERLPDERVDPRRVVVPGDIAESLRRLIVALDARLDSSPLLSHLLWREADTHEAVRGALQARYRRVADQIKAVITAAARVRPRQSDVDSAAGLLAQAVSYRHSVARHSDDTTDQMDRQVVFIAEALTAGS
jgi:AcrR family transcriptional regulator